MLYTLKSGICILKRIYLFSSSSRGLQTTFPIILSPDSLFLSVYLSLSLSNLFLSRVKGKEKESQWQEIRNRRRHLRKQKTHGIPCCIFLHLLDLESVVKLDWSQEGGWHQPYSWSQCLLFAFSSFFVSFFMSLVPLFWFKRHRKWKPCCFNTDSHCSSFREKEVWSWF